MRYIISAVTSPFGEPVGDNVTCRDPKTAIEEWCKLGEKYPSCTSLQPETFDDGMVLLKWALNNFAEVEQLLTKYRCPYKPSWMKERIEAQIKNKKTSMQWNYDEIVPFCMG